MRALRHLLVAALSLACLAMARQSADPAAVSPWLLQVVLQAEQDWLSGLGPVRGNIKQLQDELAYTNPALAYRSNGTLGRYNIRPSTARRAIEWAHDAGVSTAFPESPTPAQVIQFIMGPGADARLVELYLNQLRAEHPLLRDLSWQEIEARDDLVAKLYSGYAGAGGAWEAWRRDLNPGSVAQQRLGCAGAPGPAMSCELVRRSRE